MNIKNRNGKGNLFDFASNAVIFQVFLSVQIFLGTLHAPEGSVRLVYRI